ncbi:MAG TPA: hypothetical protein VMS84_07860 [Mycobacterium sp.]|jgi:hypothetical protein|nr:hypothetical protein [Mycobacterium sp.]
MSGVQVQCHTCSATAPVQWIPSERRYRYQRHFIGTGRAKLRCPASGEPVPAPTSIVFAPRNTP